MNLLSPISTLMSTDLITLPPSATIAHVAAIFSEHTIRHIPIVVGDKLVGLVSMSDFLLFKRGFLTDHDDEKIESIRLNNHDVRDIMSEAIATIAPDERITVALSFFAENAFHCLPVVKDEKLVGIITTQDIIAQLATDLNAYAEYD